MMVIHVRSIKLENNRILRKFAIRLDSRKIMVHVLMVVLGRCANMDNFFLNQSEWKKNLRKVISIWKTEIFHSDIEKAIQIYF
jgi:hypothetical protein